MRRAIALIASLLTGAVFLAAGAGAQAPRNTRFNAIGFVDYGSKPDFRVGDWVRYRITSQSESGLRDDFQLTVLIAGEEVFWGDTCFWVETWLEQEGVASDAFATLMSYSIFRDPAAFQRLEFYQRKQISALDEAGRPQEVIPRQPTTLLKTRGAIGATPPLQVDTLGRDTVSTPGGEFAGPVVSMGRSNTTTRTSADSLRYEETRNRRVMWTDPRVPITHVARESMETTVQRRVSLTGRSPEGSPLRLIDRGRGRALLVEMGRGLESRIVPADRRLAAAKPARAPGKTARPGGSKPR